MTTLTAWNVWVVVRKQPGKLRPRSRLIQISREFDTTLRFDPKHVGAHYGLALVRQDQSKFEAAAAQYEAALALDPKNADLRYDYSYSLERLGRGEEAARQVAAALEINPNFPRI